MVLSKSASLRSASVNRALRRFAPRKSAPPSLLPRKAAAYRLQLLKLACRRSAPPNLASFRLAPDRSALVSRALEKSAATRLPPINACCRLAERRGVAQLAALQVCALQIGAREVPDNMLNEVDGIAAHLTGADLQGANLKGAKLRAAILRSANLQQALIGAIWSLQTSPTHGSPRPTCPAPT